MSEYRYILERKNQKKHSCPHCNKKKCFVRYIDTADNTYLAEDVGRCDREVNCGYHFTPSQYFEQSPGKRPEGAWKPQEHTPKPKINLPYQLLTQSMAGGNNNSFTDYLRSLFPPIVVSKLIKDYHIGTSNHFNGAGCVFWFVNSKHEVRAGQVKAFDKTGHTATFIGSDKQPRKMQNVVHEVLKKAILSRGEPVPVWLAQYIEQDLKIDCFFGEHLLNVNGAERKPVAIVEAPKTAIVASAFFPQFIWLAVGALSYLKRERCGALYGRNVTLFPDLKAAEAWRERIDREGLHDICDSVSLSTYLEDNATDEEKAKGLDLCDYLERIDYIQYLKGELIQTLADPKYSGNPDATVIEFGRRGISKEIWQGEILPELVSKHNYEAV